MAPRRLPWFGKPSTGKFVAVALLVATGFVPRFLTGGWDLWWWSAAIWLLASFALVDGVTDIDPAAGQVTRTVRLVGFVPIWMSRSPLAGAVGLRLKRMRGFTTRSGRPQTEFTVLEAAAADGKAIPLAQSMHAATGQWDASLASIAAELATELRLPLVREAPAGSPSPSAPAAPRHFPIVGVSLFVTGACLLFLALDVMLAGRGADAFHRFETATGKVVSVEWQASRARRTSRGSFVAPESRATLVYRYEVDGHQEVRTRFLLLDHPRRGLRGPGEPTSLAMFAYRPGDDIVVHFSRDNPQVSYIEVGWPVVGDAILDVLPAWLVAMTFFGVIWLLWLLSRIGKERTQPR